MSFSRRTERSQTNMTRAGGSVFGTPPAEGPKDSVFSRLRPPDGFNYRPYQCCLVLPHFHLVFVFMLSVLLGFTMAVGAITGAAYGHFIFLWFLGGLLKLVNAGLCLGLLMRPNRCRVLVFLTETVMELLLTILGFVCLGLLLAAELNISKWRTKEKDEAWFSSRVIREEIRKVGVSFGQIDSVVILGLGFLPLTLFLIILLDQIIITYRFIKYVEDRNEFLIRSGDVPPVANQTVIAAPQSSMVSGQSRSAKPRSGTGGGRTEESQTLTRARDETWKDSAVKNGPKGASTVKKGSANGYASVYPASNSKLVALAEKKMQLKNAFFK